MTTDVVACVNGCTRRHADRTRHPVRVDLPRLVCDRCVDRLDTWLREIPEHYDRLPELLEHGTVDSETRFGRYGDAPAPMRLDIWDLLDTRQGRNRRGTVAEDCRGALGALIGWGRLVAEERRITAPASWVSGQVEFLLRHLAWIAEQVWVDDFTAEMRGLHRQLAAAVGIQPPLPVGRCAALVDDEPCGGPLWPDHVGGVHCGVCGDRWSSATLARLGAGLPAGVAS